MKTNRASLILVAALAQLAAHPRPSRGDFSLAGIFNQGMVLQRDTPVPVWGRAEPGSEIRVAFRDHAVTARADDGGRWRAELPAMTAGGPFDMTIAASGTDVTLKGLLVGDVWLCAGDAPMQKMVCQVPAEAAQAIPPLPESVRFVQVPGSTPGHPASDFPKRLIWSQGQPVYLSAVATAFAGELLRGMSAKGNEAVPIGLIQVTRESMPLEGWAPREALAADAVTKPLVDEYDRAVDEYDRAVPEHLELFRRWTEQMDEAERTGSGWPNHPALPVEPRSRNKPAGVYHGMIAPLTPFPIRGVVWQNGEAEVPRTDLFRHVFPAIISGWRTAWKSERLPFLFVELGASGGQPGDAKEVAWSAFREAQKEALKLPATTMVPSLDVQGPELPLVLGRRIAGLAVEKVYGGR